MSLGAVACDGVAASAVSTGVTRESGIRFQHLLVKNCGGVGRGSSAGGRPNARGAVMEPGQGAAISGAGMVASGDTAKSRRWGDGSPRLAAGRRFVAEGCCPCSV